MSEVTNSHLFALKTTGGQEKVVLRLLEAKMRSGTLDVQSVLVIDNLKGYVVIEAAGPQEMFMSIQDSEGKRLRHVKDSVRGELQFSEIESYLIKKSTVSELAVDGTVEVIGGPFKGMKATITRVDHDKEEATVILLDAPYQLPVTVDANYLKPVAS
ncbi:MAG: transcription elongation factor Spt5 [Candidatus Nitrosopelagicus sp.]|nr:transcription elongation factor Spt5 [Candidatus Nitrosopelagicus sp.]